MSSQCVSERECEIPALDGFWMAATVFEPVVPGPRRAALIASATGVKRERYARLARYLVRDGWSVVTFDYRGVGGSRDRHVQDLPHTMFEWGAKDLAGVIAWIDAEWAPMTLVAVAHSIGGQVLPFAPNHARVQALLAIGCQKGYWPLWTGVAQRLQCLAFWWYIRLAVRLTGYLPMGFAGCEDLPPGVALEWQRWGMNDDFVGANGASLAHHHASFRGSILAYSFADDVFAPRAAVQRLLRFYSGARRQHRHIHPGEIGLRALGHSGFFDDPASEPLWKEVSAWLKQPELQLLDAGKPRRIEETNSISELI